MKDKLLKLFGEHVSEVVSWHQAGLPSAQTKEVQRRGRQITAILDAQQALEDAVRTFCEAKGDDVPMALLRNLSAIDKLKATP